jgi:hypothetical protein
VTGVQTCALPISITEPFSVNDSSVAINQFTVVRVENVGVNDGSIQQSDFLQSITEAITLLDDLCYNGWFRIDDSQNASWAAISTPMGVWVDINDAQAPSWAAISTPAGVWVDVNDAQTPSWGVIDTSQPCK